MGVTFMVLHHPILQAANLFTDTAEIRNG